jgi:phosphatidate cytidylyltransferase
VTASARGREGPIPVLAKRIVSGLLLGAVALVALFLLPSIVGVALLLAFATIGVLEFYGILNRAGVPAFRILGAVSGGVLLGTTYLSLTAFLFLSPFLAVTVTGDEMQSVALFFIVFAICIRQFPQKNNPQPLPTIACTMFGVMYVPFLLSFVLLLALYWTPVGPLERFGPPARWLLLYLLIVVKLSDMGAFFVGSLCGRHKMFPRISPGKTWEGLAGGLSAGVLASVTFFYVMTRTGAHRPFGDLALNMADAWLLGLLLAGVGVLGDLVESLLKRAAGQKDSGLIVPGMGGVLDVLDSLLFAAPMLYYYLRWFVVPR